MTTIPPELTGTLNSTNDQPAPTPPDAVPAKARPIAVEVGKRERTRLAKSEVYNDLADIAAAFADGAADWPADDPRWLLCHTYQLTRAELAHILTGVANELRKSAARRGFDQAWR